MRQSGHDLDLSGHDTDHITLSSDLLHRNPYPGRRWIGEEIAMATLLQRTGCAVRAGALPAGRGGAGPAHVALAIEESADSGTTVTISCEART